MAGMGKDIAVIDPDKVDDYIMKWVGKKPISDIAKSVGMEPNACLRRKAELLDAVDVLTIQQKRQQAIMKVSEMAEEAHEKAKTIASEFYAGTINAAVGAMKVILGELNRMEKDSSGLVETLNQMRLLEIKRYINDVIMITVRQASNTFPGIDEDKLLDMFQENLVVAAQGIDE